MKSTNRAPDEAFDHKVQGLALARIRRRARGVADFKHTLIGQLHLSIARVLTLAVGELPIACGFFSEHSWWLVTTRRISSQHQGLLRALDPRDGIIVAAFGDDPKGTAHAADAAHCAVGSADNLATVTAADGRQLHFEFETGAACMVPIQACHFWQTATGLHYR